MLEALTGHNGIWGTVAIDSTHVKSHRSEAQKGGLCASDRHLARRRTSKLQGLTDEDGRPRILLISAGNVNDMQVGEIIERAAGHFTRLIADKRYDTNTSRATVAARGGEAVIPSPAPRRAPISYDHIAYRARNLVERLWCRLKHWRRIATPRDKLAANFLSGALIAATLTYGGN